MGNRLSPQIKEESSIEEVPLNSETTHVLADDSNFVEVQDYKAEQPDEKTLKKLLGQTVESKNPSHLKVQLILDALEEIEGERSLKNMRDCIEEHSRSTGINFGNLEDSLSRLESAIYRKN
uniref:Isoleucine--tRNA ligase 2 n=1 Tax=Lygus hesperus TaxID=30085 RepID=A0A0A9Y729_LYGHE